jgi:hypothetical protein
MSILRGTMFSRCAPFLYKISSICFDSKHKCISIVAEKTFM